MTNFAVFANGTFWGTAEASTAEEAIQAIADEHGTIDVGQEHASTEGMTAKPFDECSNDELKAAWNTDL